MTPLIALYRGKSVISRLIQWQTRSPYSHAAIYFPKTQEVIEAWHIGGVQKNKVLELHTEGTEIDLFRVNADVDWEEAVWFATSKIGKRYDFTDIFRFLTRTPAILDNKWFCSELVFESLKHAGTPLLSRVNSWEVTPGMLALSPLLIKV